MKERIANLCFLRNRMRARRDELLRVPEAAELLHLVQRLAMVERNLDELRKADLDRALSGMRRSA